MSFVELAYKWRHNKIMLKAITKSYIRHAKRRQSAATESASKEKSLSTV